MQLVLDWLKSNTMLCMISNAILYLIATESSKKERTNGMRQRCKKGVHHKKRSGMPLEPQVMRRVVLSYIRAVQASFKSFSLLAYGSCPPYPAVGYIFQVA